MKTFTTLYRSANPHTSVMDGEYYQPLIDGVENGGKIKYFVRETHAWFDDLQKKPINIVTTLSPEEGLDDVSKAHKIFDQQVEHRVKEGFRHSFYIDPFAPKHIGYVDLGHMSMDFDEFKKLATELLGYTQILRIMDVAQPVSLASWNGVGAGTSTPYITVTVTYSIEGDRVRVRKMAEADIWYRLL
jgi:hypothetical protein